MAVGINDQDLNTLKISLLDYIESINALSKRFETSCFMIEHNILGPGTSIILNRLGVIRDQIPVVVSNINSYISDINRVQQMYRDQDQEESIKITSDISILESMKGE